MRSKMSRNVLTLGVTATDVAISALELPRNFSRQEMLEAYGKRRSERDLVLPENWQQIVSMQMQRLCPDRPQYGGQLPLFAFRGRGGYTMLDDQRPLLTDAANRNASLLHFTNRLVVPLDVERDLDDALDNHIIGAYAQKRIMEAVRSRGCRILDDTSAGKAFDFIFMDPRGRTPGPQIMECKGTRKTAAVFEIGQTRNELTVYIDNRRSYWFGIVYEIKVKDGAAYGGTEPFISLASDEWEIITTVVRWRRRPLELPLS